MEVGFLLLKEIPVLSNKTMTEQKDRLRTPQLRLQILPRDCRRNPDKLGQESAGLWSGDWNCSWATSYQPSRDKDPRTAQGCPRQRPCRIVTCERAEELIEGTMWKTWRSLDCSEAVFGSCI